MEYKDYYKTLGVPRGADDKAIKSAYRRLARKHHPDVSKGSARRFQEINEAYAVLSDPDKRKRYDTLGSDWERYAQAGDGGGPFTGGGVHFGRGADPADAAGFSDFFRTIFRDFRSQAGGAEWAPGGGFGAFSVDDLGAETGASPDVEAALEIGLEEAFRGASKAITLAVEEACASCGGSGRQGRQACAACGGTGATRSTRRLEVKIPAGVDSGARIRVAGEGRRGVRGQRGDLFLRVTVRAHAPYERKGDDLYVDVPVEMADAALGAEVAVPTLKGTIAMKVPPETSSGRVLRIPGYGMPHVKGGGAGDQFVRVQVTIPRGLSAREKELLTELKRLRSEKTS
jgi:DnaJ-class molecular chaperone